MNLEKGNRKKRSANGHDAPMQESKRHCTHEAAKASIHSLPDAVLKECLSFVGPGHHLFVSTVDKRFRKVYNHNNTSLSAAACSVSRAELILKLRREAEIDALSSIAIGASKIGCLDVLEWAHSKGCEFEKALFFEVVSFGHVHVLRWADRKGIPWFSDLLLFHTIYESKIDALDFMFSSDKALDFSYIARIAAGKGSVAVLRWLREHDLLEARRDVWSAAARFHDTSVLDWLFNDENRPHEDVLIAALIVDRRDNILWARGHGINCDSLACAIAALRGNLPLLQWLRENEFAWDGRVLLCDRLVDSDGRHDRIVEWARENGCPH